MKNKIASKRASRYYLDFFCDVNKPDVELYKLYKLPKPDRKKFFYWYYLDGRKPDKYIMTFAEFRDLYMNYSYYDIYGTLKAWRNEMYEL